MARTTSSAVQVILGNNYPSASSPDLTPYLDTASNIVDQAVECAADRDITLSDTTLELMERWLAAHFYLVTDPRYKSKSTGRASASFYDTDYSAQAIALDSSGCLVGILKGTRAQLLWLGKPPSSQIDYRDRD